MKTCNTCGITKSKLDYYKHPKSADRLQGMCKECHKENTKINRIKNIEYYREYDAWRFKNDPKVRERHKRYQETEGGRINSNNAKKKFIKRNPEKRAAHIIVGNAVRSGVLIKPKDCPVCGEFKPSRQIHAHHDDYTKPLEVRWMCASCHSKEHHGE